MPKKIRNTAITSAFSFQALGALSGAGIGLFILVFYPYPDAWRWMFMLTIIPAVIICILRTKLPESPLWLQSKQQHEKAARVTAKLINKDPEILVKSVKLDKNTHEYAPQKKYFYYELFTKRYFRQTLLTSVPWFIMDICLYGVGIFSTMILAIVFADHANTSDSMAQNFILSDIRATMGSIFLDLFLIIGFLSAIFTVKKLGTIRLQNIGFLGMTVGLIVLGFATHYGNNEFWVIVGFVIFNLMVNFGPNPTTYMLPTERFPPSIRASGHGFAASSGKVGAAIGIFFLPVFIQSIGIPSSMFILALCSFMGFVCTAILSRQPLHSGTHIISDKPLTN